MNKINIKTDFIKLDQLLKYANIVCSGGEAKIIISEGLIKVNDEICLQRGKKIRSNDIIEFDNTKYIITKEE